MENKNHERYPGDKRRKLVRILCWVLGIICTFALAVILWSYAAFLFALNSTSVGIIGGADGPTAVFVTTRLPGPSAYIGTVFLPLAGILLAIYGIFKTRKP